MDFIVAFQDNDIFSQAILGNTVFGYSTAAISFIILIAFLYLLKLLLVSQFRASAKRSKTLLDDTIIKILNTILKLPFYTFVSAYIVLLFLNVDEVAMKIIESILIIWVLIQVILIIQILIDFYIQEFVAEDEEESTEKAVSTISTLIKLAVWIIGVLLIISNLGFDITSLVAGLGIGGIAIAFALQNILSDLFSSFAIYFDKPFIVGDFVIVDDILGTIEKVGIKTTRIRSLDGEQIIVSNKELTSSEIRNYRRMTERRVVFNVGIVYETQAERLREIPGVIKKIIESQKHTRFYRSHLIEYEDSALVFETAYFITTGDYLIYRDTHQEILLTVKEQLEKLNIEFAYPTQFVYKKDV